MMKRGKTREAKFQWREDDTYKSFLMRMNDLYAKGVKIYLDKEIKNLADDKIDKILKGKNAEKIKEQFIEAILYTNNDFAFSDVYNEHSFEQNAKIVREIVKLLQPYKIQYTHKQQFLSEFF